MLNINYGKNRKLMEACEPLKEYSWLVETVREFQKAEMNLEEAVDSAINKMPEEFLLKKFLLSNKAEVKGMFLTEFDMDKFKEQERREVNERVARDMLKRNYPLSAIEEISQLSTEAILKLAKKLGLTVS